MSWREYERGVGWREGEAKGREIDPEITVITGGTAAMAPTLLGKEPVSPLDDRSKPVSHVSCVITAGRGARMPVSATPRYCSAVRLVRSDGSVDDKPFQDTSR